jgi:hypothetical protein
MASHKKSSIMRKVINFISVVPLMGRAITHVFHLIESESRLAGKYLLLFLIYGVMFGLLITFTWLCLLAMLCVYLISLQMSWLVALFIIFIINLLLLTVVTLLILNIKKEVFFPQSRKLLHRIKD